MKGSHPVHRKVRVVRPYPITHQFKVSDDFTGKTLLEMMASRFPFRSRDKWEERISLGFVGINDKTAAADYILKKSDRVFHHNPAVVEPSVPDEVEVLIQNPDYLIVYKPAPMPMHPGGRFNKNSLTHILEEQGFDDLKIVHRLDAVTSGLVLFARNKTFSKKAMICFSESRVRKTYYALVAGRPEEDERTIDMPIRRKTGFVFESKLGLPRAKEALTHFEVVERGEKLSVIRCRPKTGRTHQIRLHLEQWGYPIWDDPIYGPGGDKSSRKTQNFAIGLLNAGLDIEDLGIQASLDIPESWKEWIQDPEFVV